MTEIKSPAKIQMIDFIRQSKLDVPYEFTLKGSKADAERFVHRMRVELSRMRDLVKLQGRTPKHFKMMFKEIIVEGDKTRIVLIKTESARNVDNEVDDILEQIGGGMQIW